MTNNKSSPISYKAGWVLTAILTLAMLANGLFSLFGNMFAPEALAQVVETGGFKMEQSATLGLIMLICAIVYAIPRTAVLGAILMTGFLGGAIATEYRIGLVMSSSQLTNLVLGLLTWGGLFLRDARVRALLPFTS